MDAFLPRNAMHSDNYAVCPSDWHYVETAKLIVKRFSPSGCHTILVFFVPTVMIIFRRGLAQRGRRMQGGTKKSLYLGNDTRYPSIYIRLLK